MSLDELNNQLHAESEKLAQLQADYERVKCDHLREAESYCHSEGGSGRQEELREKRFRESEGRRNKAEAACEHQKRVVDKLSEQIKIFSAAQEIWAMMKYETNMAHSLKLKQ